MLQEAVGEYFFKILLRVFEKAVIHTYFQFLDIILIFEEITSHGNEYIQLICMNSLDMVAIVGGSLIPMIYCNIIFNLFGCGTNY